MPAKLNIEVGQRFGRFTVISEAPRRRRLSGASLRYVNCSCECGSVKEVRLSSLTEGTTVSCGCFHREQAKLTLGSSVRTHGSSRTLLYGIWVAMKQRCFNPNNKSYRRYGARGISMAPEWCDDFQAFSDHMGPRPDGMTVDRIDNSGNYEPGNVQWATYTQQARNTRRNHLHTIDGVTRCLAEWCEVLNEPWSTVKKRVAAGNDPFIRKRTRRTK